jgi:hypothetical protein
MPYHISQSTILAIMHAHIVPALSNKLKTAKAQLQTGKCSGLQRPGPIDGSSTGKTSVELAASAATETDLNVTALGRKYC